MNADIFAEWLRRQGYRVLRTPSSYWCEASPHVYQAFPYHWLIEPAEGELRGLLVRHNGVALRYSAPLAARRGKASYHVVCEDPAYDLPALSRQARQNVRRGLRNASVELIPLERLASEGWLLRRETLGRQGREEAESEAWWRRLCLSAEGLPGFEAWGAIYDGALASAFLALRCDDWYILAYQQSASAYQDYRVNNALFYTVVRQVLEREGISKVFMGLQSLDAPPTVDQFKFRMGFSARAVRQRVVFHPLLAPFVNGISHSVVERRLARNPEDPTLAKVEGMVRFYVEGKDPASEQDWPECLEPCKAELLEAIGAGAE